MGLNNKELQTADINVRTAGKSNSGGYGELTRREREIVDRIKNWDDTLMTPQAIKEGYDVTDYGARKMYNKLCEEVKKYSIKREERRNKMVMSMDAKKSYKQYMEKRMDFLKGIKRRSPLFGIKMMPEEVDEELLKANFPLFGLKYPWMV